MWAFEGFKDIAIFANVFPLIRGVEKDCKLRNEATF